MWGQIGREGVWQGKLWNKRKSGEEYLELLSISAVKDDSGDVIRDVATFTDVTPEGVGKGRDYFVDR